MRLLASALNLSLFALFAGTALAQNGSIAGTVTNSVGEPVANAPVQARDSKSNAVFKATSSKTGAYSVANLPAGVYDLTVNVAGLKGYERKGIAVAAGSVRVDVRLEEGTQLSTLGEDSLAIVANQKLHAPPSGPTPRTLAGKPDFSGVWWSPATVDPGKPEWLPQADAAAKKRMDDNRVDSPQSHCMPGAVTRLGPLYELVQSPEFIVEISDDNSPGFHQIYLDGHKHPADPNPSWYGHNVGHWEGDTLVVDRVAFDPRVWLDQGGHPHSEKLHVVERYRRPDLGHLETEITVEDPGVLARPFTQKRVSELAAGLEISEFICTENERDNLHLLRK